MVTKISKNTENIFCRKRFRNIAVLLKLLWWQKYSKISFVERDWEILQCCWNCCGDPGLSAIASHRWLFGSKTDALCHFDRCFYFARKRISFVFWQFEGLWKLPNKDMLWFAVFTICIRWPQKAAGRIENKEKWQSPIEA